MKAGDKVLFQFDDEGVTRTSSGIFLRVTAGGKYTCQLEHTNIVFDCLPWAVRPYKFSYKGLKRRIANFAKGQVYKSWAGSYPKEEMEEIKREAKIAAKEIHEFIKWLKNEN